MNCKTCGAPLEEGAKECKNCGTTLLEMGIIPKPEEKVGLKKDGQEMTDFEKRAAQFGGVQVKERKASAFATVDPKMLSLVILMVIVVVFFSVKAIFDQKKVTVNMDGFKVTLPASMREIDDDSFEVRKSEKSKSYSNTTLDFAYVKYNAATLIPGLNDVPEDSDIEGLTEYFEAQNKLLSLERDFVAELDEIYKNEFDDYERVSMKEGKLNFVFANTNGVKKYAEIRIVVVDQTVYQFCVICTESDKDRMSKKFNQIFDSIDMKKVDSSSEE